MTLPTTHPTPLSLFAKRSASILSSLALAATLAGCSMGSISLSGPAAVSSSVTLSGTVHGGQQPVAGAVIQLYVAGTTGYGLGAAALIPTGSYAPGGAKGCVVSNTVTCNTNVQTDANGNFSITGDYTCPTTGNPLVYITATGGNPGLTSGTNNTALKLATPLGLCSSLSSSQSITINEVTTAATAFALGQYFTPVLGATSTDAFGAPSTTQAQTGLANAFATAALLASPSSGIAVTSSNLTGAGATLTAVPESAKLNTIADILAACVNSTGASDPAGACSTLFTDVTPTGGVPPTDTLQAAVDMSLNPTSTNTNSSTANITALFGLASAFSPFPGLASQPTDWTLGIQYQDNTGTFFLKPQNIAVDGVGNVWVLSNASGPSALVQVSPTGTPLTNVSSLSEYGPFASPIANPPALSSPKTTTTTFTTQNTVATTTFGQASSNPSLNARNLAIDPSNNVWFTQSSSSSSTTGGSNGTTTIPISGNVFEIATSSTTGIPTGSTFGFATGKSAYGLAIDSTGNVFVGQQSSSSYFGVYEFPANSTPGNGLLTPVAFPVNSSTALPEYMSLDKTGNIIYTPGTGTLAYQLAGANDTTCGTLTANSLCQPTGSSYSNITLPSGATGAYGVAEGTTGTWIANSATTSNSLELLPFGTTTAPTAFGDASHFTAPRLPAVDGLGNVWVANSVGPNATTNTTGGSISALTATGSYISPSNGGSTSIGPGFNHLGITFGYGTAIDPSGNVWVANNQAFTSACSTTLTNTSNTCTSIFELVGAAAPVVTPISATTVTGPTRP
jgi:hypothetical protein